MGIFTEIGKEKLIEFYEYFESLRDGNQRRKLGEEHQELIEELAFFDKGVGDIQDIIKEVADNIILIFEHVYALDITDDEIIEAIRQKMKRTDQRKQDKYYEK